MGSSSEDADALLKRHDEFLAKLNAQDEKMKILTDQFIKLNNTGSNKHFAINEIEDILKQLTAKRQKLKATAVERKQKLNKSKEFFEFKNQCDDLNAWIGERQRHAQTIYSAAEQIKSAETFYLIEKYLNKHEALEKELNSNRTRLEKLKLIATGMEKHPSASELLNLVSAVEENWVDLEKEAKVKGKHLQETKYKADLSASLSDVDSRMKNLEDTLNTKYNTGDLRSVKEALKKHNDLRNQLEIEVDLLGDLAKVEGNKTATENAVREYMHKFKLLNPMIEQKQKKLEADLVVQQIIFDMNEEMKWIEQNKKQIVFITAQMPNSLFEGKCQNIIFEFVKYM